MTIDIGEILEKIEKSQRLVDFLNPNNLDDENISYILDEIWKQLEEMKELLKG